MSNRYRFHYINYDEYKVGASYEYKDNHTGIVVDLGVLVSKKLVGRPYDQDIILTFKKPVGTTYEYEVNDNATYREKW